MAWNEPDDKEKKGQSPWGNKKDAPPNIDEALKTIQNKLRKIVGGGRKHPVTGGPDENGSGGAGLLIGLIVFVAVLFWALSGIYIVGPAEKAAVLRFGKYIETVGPGPHWIPRFIDRKIVRNVDVRMKYAYSAHMLTKDENIADVAIEVRYRIGDLENYLFNVSDPIETLHQATASALRQVIGHNGLDSIITEGRESWGDDVQILLRSILAEYKVGINVEKVSPQSARAPEKVQDAFDDAISAREDERRYKEKALAYRAKVLPIAKGNARRLIEFAEGRNREVVLQAQGAVAEFLALLPEYKLAPAIMRERMYLDTMQQVLSQSSKILVDGRAGNMIYLPLERLLNQHVDKHNQQSVPLKMGQFTDDVEKSKPSPVLRQNSGGGRLFSSNDFGSGRNF
jgi:membrane protease subunit HflK